MRKVWLVIKREYTIRVRSKTFLWTTIALPLFTIGIFAFAIFLGTREVSRTVKIAIVDQAGGLGTSVAQGLTEKLPDGRPLFQVVKTLESPSPSAQNFLRQDVRKGQLDGYLVIPTGILSGKAAPEFHTSNAGYLTLVAPLNRAAGDAVITRRLQDQGIRIKNVRQIIQIPRLRMIKETKQGEAEEKGQTFVTAIAVGMLLYVTLLVYGITTMRSVLEEKSTRIIEILIASIRPSDLMAGKILGVAGVALTQYSIWALAGGIFVLYGTTLASTLRQGAAFPQIHLSGSLLIYVVIFFLAGYLLYASIYAAIGAMVSTEQDAQQVQIPVSMLIVVSFLLFNIIVRDPNSTTSVVLSMLPFLSPILMVLRIAIQTPPLWQILLSLALSLLATIGVVHVSARIYRVGVLMQGKRPSLRELIRWLRYT